MTDQKPTVEAVEPPAFPFGLCCYLVPRNVDTEHLARAVIGESSLEEVWLTTAEVQLRDQPFLAVSLQMLKDTSAEGGSPVMHGGVAEVLSEQRGYVLVVLVAAGGEEAALGLFQNGEHVQNLSDHPLPQTADPVLDRLSPEECLAIDGLAELAQPLCGERSLALHLKRELSFPAWAPRTVDIFRFSERNNLGVDPEEESDGGRICFLALDMEPLRKDVRRSVKGGIHILESYARPESKRFLGPMSVDLPPLLDELRDLEGNLPLNRAGHFGDLAELLALVSTRLSSPGNRLEYWDQVFFPLLNLNGDTLPITFDEDDLDDMEPMDLLTAMADQLPYYAPEGELLESLADEELTPLLAELGVDRSGSGSVFLLDTGRLRERLDALAVPDFGDRCDKFAEKWWDSRWFDTDEEREAWVDKRLSLDQPALNTFFATWAELRTLIDTAERNNLQVALLFYE